MLTVAVGDFPINIDDAAAEPNGNVRGGWGDPHDVTMASSILLTNVDDLPLGVYLCHWGAFMPCVENQANGDVVAKIGTLSVRRYVQGPRRGQNQTL